MFTIEFQHRLIHSLVDSNWNATTISKVHKISNKQSSHVAFAKYELYNARSFSENFVWLNALSTRIMLFDDLLWLVKRNSNFSNKVKEIRFFADFDSKEDIHDNRSHRDKIAKYVDEIDVWYYRTSLTQSSDVYLLWDDEEELAYVDMSQNQRTAMIRTSIAIQNNKHSITTKLLDALTIFTFNINITISFALVAIANQSISATVNLNINATVNSNISATVNSNINVIVNSNINVTTNSNSFVKSASSLVDSKVNNVDIDNDDDEEKKMSTSVANIVQKKKVKRQRFATRKLSRSKFIDEKTKKSKALKEMNDDISEKNHKRRKTIDTSIKSDKTLKSEIKNENNDELLSDSRLSQLRFRDLSSTQELKNVETFLRFARNSNNQIYELFQRIEIFLTDLNECAISTIKKATIDELITIYRIWRNQRKKMKITLSVERLDLVKLVTQHIDSTIKKVNHKFLSICYVVIREKRFKSNINIEYDIFKKYWAKTTKWKLWVIRTLNYDSESYLLARVKALNYENMILILSKNETLAWALSFFCCRQLLRTF